MRDPWVTGLAFLCGAVAWIACGWMLLHWPTFGQPHPVCLVAHSQVLLIPTLCSKVQVCDVPIVAKVCDQIEIENPEVKP